MELTIQPNRTWWKIHLREVWEYRDLLRFLVYRDFVARYKQTILGPLWFIVQPLMTTMVFTVIFGNFAGIPTDGHPQVLFYLSGLLAWNYFSTNFGHASGTFLANSHLFGKVYFPRLVTPLAGSLTNTLSFGLNFLVFLAFWCWFKWFHPSGTHLPGAGGFLILPLLLLHGMILSLGIGLWMAAFTAKYRDFQFLMGFLTQLWMYATPIIYPLSQVPEKWRWISNANPMTQVVEASRHFLLGPARDASGTPIGDMFSWNAWSISFAISAFLCYTGILLFQRTERNFVDTV